MKGDPIQCAIHLVIFHYCAEHLLSDSDLEVLSGFECQLCLGPRNFLYIDI